MNSLEKNLAKARAARHPDKVAAASRENGKKGGRPKRVPEIVECTNGMCMVLLGDEIITREKTMAEAEEYVAAMNRGDC